MQSVLCQTGRKNPAGASSAREAGPTDGTGKQREVFGLTEVPAHPAILLCSQAGTLVK